MLPFRDNIPSRAFPVVTLGLIAVNVLVFLYEVSLPQPRLESFILQNGVVPARLQELDQAPLAVLSATGCDMLTSMFLHGGWLHLIGNMWFLWIFGDNVEDRMGHFRFLTFYLLCGFLAEAAHIAFNLNSRLPSIGASGAVAGVLGAYLVSYPFARVQTIIPLFVIFTIVELPALLVLSLWFVFQLVSGLAAVAATTATTGGVAWWAHIGGFIAGLVLITPFARRQVRRYRWET